MINVSSINLKTNSNYINNNSKLKFGCSECSLGKKSVNLLVRLGINEADAIKHLDTYASTKGFTPLNGRFIDHDSLIQKTHKLLEQLLGISINKN